MKRRISIFLVLILCFCFWAEPVSAAESFDSSIFNVLDYCSAFSNGQNNFTVYGKTSVTWNFGFEVSAIYMNVLFRSTYGADIVSVASTWNDSSTENLTVTKLGNGYFRAYGYVRSASYSKVVLTFTTSDGVTKSYLDVLSINLMGQASSYDETCTCEIEAQGYTGSPISYSSADATNLRSWTAPPDYTLGYLELRLYCDDWKNYDYLDYSVYLSCTSVNSVTAMLGSQNLPVSVTPYDNDAVVVSDFRLNIRLDLRSLIRVTNEIPIVYIDANCASGELTIVSVEGCYGVVDTVTTDYSSHFLQQISNNISSLESWITAQTSSLGIYFQAQNDLLTSEFSALQAINDAGFKKIESWISAQTTGLQLEFSQSRLSLANHFSNLSTWLSDHVSSLKLTIETQLSYIRSQLTDHFNDLEVWLQDHTDYIVSAIIGDPTDSEELDQESDQIKDDIDGIGQFEQDQQAVLNENFDTIQDSVSITGFAAALAFVQSYTNLIFVGIDDYIIVFLLPLFLGLFFYICSRVPGATRWRSRPPKDGGGS